MTIAYNYSYKNPILYRAVTQGRNQNLFIGGAKGASMGPMKHTTDI